METTTTIIICPNCGTRNRIDSRADQLQPVCGRCGARLDGGEEHVLEVTDDTFWDRVLRVADKPVLVDFWAPWCGPCRMLAPTIDRLAQESAGRYVVAKLNTDDNPGVAQQYRISSIPTLLVFKNGKLVHQMVGVQRCGIFSASDSTRFRSGLSRLVA